MKYNTNELLISRTKSKIEGVSIRINRSKIKTLFQNLTPQTIIFVKKKGGGALAKSSFTKYKRTFSTHFSSRNGRLDLFRLLTSHLPTLSLTSSLSDRIHPYPSSFPFNLYLTMARSITQQHPKEILRTEFLISSLFS